jgi:hypothetical protein
VLEAHRVDRGENLAVMIGEGKAHRLSKRLARGFVKSAEVYDWCSYSVDADSDLLYMPTQCIMFSAQSR